ncbi:MAG TPA: PilC/PilY family type IV pilus protein [Oxalicibacterium sp.]|uniref:pilus assembly protein n=1 Tax=Oxalicibacterium sp. TaxID=2766525 RepID=UPI002D0AFA5F|nr:PilC/PilY family type IV pilus protein [Oxalicibacterium sp.]HWU99439.1 PilC/PilY family type IV pilus protein [Oxalicibacterium sp.]
MSTEQKDLLHRSSRAGNEDQLGEERLNYLRGNRLHETDKHGSGFPSRDQLLGAIVHGVPKYIGAPSATLDGHSYQDYFEANRARTPVVYVGTGNGMLHAFDANKGEELFAYIPEALFSRLPELTTLTGARALPLDGGIDVAEVHADNKWKSVLVAGMGRSAQGVFALDVTEPEDFDADDVLWEFTDANDVDIGNVVGMPVIAKFKTSLTNGKPQYRYFAVVANGVNNYQADGQSNVAASNALFLLALDKRRTEPWVAGVNYFKFTLPISDAKSTNGMSDVALVRIADGSVSHGYAGDMQGNLWRFDFSGLPPWPNVLGSKPPKPLFVARDAGGKRQPISQKPHAVYAPANGHVVLFGTGKYLEQNDLGKNAYTMQSFYAVWDDGGKRIAGRSELTERTLLPSDDGNTLEIGGGSFQYGMSGAGDKGWYVDFIDSAKTGERSVSPASLFDLLLAFRTLIPHSNRCAKPIGRFYVLNTLTGLPAAASFTGELSDAGFPGVPIIVSTAPTEIAERDATGKRRVTRKLEISDSDSPTQTEKSLGRKTIVETVMTAGRLSWREIVNWVELRSGK